MKNRVKRILLLALAIAVIFFPSAKVAVAESTEVYLGGMPIGIGLAENGLIVTGLVDVITDEGGACPARGSEILTDDVIVKVNGKSILSVSDFASEVQRAESSVILTVKRGEREFLVPLTPVTDSLTGLKKLGLTLKNGINGIGTLTFVTESNHFGALGHGITDVDTGKPFYTDFGHIYSCEISGFKKAEKGKAGELTGHFTDRESPIGTIHKCNAFGVYGIMNNKWSEPLTKIALGGQKEVKTGAAYIYSTISGNTPKAYKIDIVKASTQKTPQEKSMLIRVTDPELLRETGGILQGMSGSPIVQGGKLIGAVTHVLINDSTLGYGLYVDWMMENAA